MNPKTNRLEELSETPILENTFRCEYIGETSILFEPVGIPLIGEETK